MYTRNCILIFLAFFTCLSFSNGQKHYFKAERQFELKAFDLAIENAKKELEKDPDCIECHRLIAESFRMTNNNVDAAIWYRKMESFPNLPNDYAFNYGLLLKRMGQYDKAKKYFNDYKVVDLELGEYFASSCDFAKAELSRERDFELNLFGISSKHTDFGPAIYKDKVVFSSFRPDFHRNIDKKNTSIIQDEKCQFFIASNSFRSDLNSIQFLLNDSQESFDMGPIHYAADAPVCAVTKHDFKDGEKQIFTNDLELSLYLAKVESDGAFSELLPFPHNEVGYATGFGTLNPKGNILYFSSNRPGGQGGFDIYVSYFKNGSWTYPSNLGPKINTAGNEITPFYDGENLYFSSDHTTGLGGFDVFKSSVDAGKWAIPENMGNGVNSPEDDYYFTKHPQAESYYLTSNRLGGRGSHDIYLVHKIERRELSLDMAEAATPKAVDLTTAVINQTSAPTVKKVSEESVPLATTSIIPTTSTSAEAKAIAPKTETKTIDFNELLPPKAVELNKTNARYISVAGAKRVAVGEVILTNSNVYFIQLAAMFKSEAKMENFSSLTRYGSLYKMYQSSATKVKLGYFFDEQEAKEILRQVKSNGHNDAFITYEALNTARMELVDISNNNTSHSTTVSSSSAPSYKVRLASYEDPIWFDVAKVNDIGVIEQWSKGEWTIFVLSGFNSLDEAEMARAAALNRGFHDAEVVRDRGGILEDLD